MWSLKNTTIWRRFAGVVVALGVSGLLTGCFQPLYGEHSPNGGPSVADALRGVEVSQIDAPNGTPAARLGVEVRNALLFDLTGGSGGTPPTHRLKIKLSSVRQQVIVDVTTGRADVENYGIDAAYSLTDLKTNKVVISGRTFARVSYDIPGQEQRFAAARALRDAENRAAKVIADQIHSRLASFFVTGS
jgi:LPS-assembly lipoprotein